MPIYTFMLYLEIERQSYVVDYKMMIIQQVLLLSAMVCSNLLSYRRTQGKSPLTDIHSPISAKITTAIALIIVFVTSTLSINTLRTNTWGDTYILAIFIIPTLLNIVSGDAAAQISQKLSDTFITKSNAAPPAYIGALSGYTIIIGYKTTADTFWPFVISLLMMALHATFCHDTDHDNNSNAAPQLYWYAIGIVQATAIMFCDL